MRTRANATTLALIFLLAAPMVSAVGARGPIKWFLTPYEMELYLELTEEQVAATRDLLEQRRADLVPLVEQQRALREEMAALLEAEDPDLEAIGALVVELDTNRQVIREIEDHFEADFEALLDPVQLLKYEHMRELTHLLRTRNPRESDGDPDPELAPSR